LISPITPPQPRPRCPPSDPNAIFYLRMPLPIYFPPFVVVSFSIVSEQFFSRGASHSFGCFSLPPRCPRFVLPVFSNTFLWVVFYVSYLCSILQLIFLPPNEFPHRGFHDSTWRWQFVSTSIWFPYYSPPRHRTLRPHTKSSGRFP